MHHTAISKLTQVTTSIIAVYQVGGREGEREGGREGWRERGRGGREGGREGGSGRYRETGCHTYRGQHRPCDSWVLSQLAQGLEALLGNTQESLDEPLGLPLEARVIVLGEDDSGRHVLLQLADEMEACAGQELLPPVHGANFGLDGLSGGVLGLHHTITVGEALQGGDDLAEKGQRSKAVSMVTKH